MGENMVGVINPNATQTLQEQRQKAAEAKFEVTPGGTIPQKERQAYISQQEPARQLTLRIPTTVQNCLAAP